MLLQPAVDTDFEDRKLSMRATYIYADEVSDLLLDRLIKLEDAEENAVFVIGFTYRHFTYGNVTEDLLKAYNNNLTRLVVPFDHLIAQKSKVLWKLQDRVSEEKLVDNWKAVLNKDIDRLNQVVRSVFRYADITIWEAAWQISTGLTDSAVDGYKLCDLGLRQYTQLLLNMYCNDYMNYNDGSCCSSAEPYTLLQIVTYAVFAVWYIFISDFYVADVIVVFLYF